ncbi:hypothetical protein H7I41_20150 [Mycobacterium manitobense]|uniref:Peptidase M50 n=1 Tax=[Mycobacterium] manitobense TaxID=190147 RepID=A0A9X3BVX1_9MYCO|nr:hypothetical protein [[Mycobacterium] manitobense]MCV7172233.1 hypothetical protein [[Mycobacterium] manitobense]
MTTTDVAVLRCGDRPAPRPLRMLPTVELDEVDRCRRVVVRGDDAQLAAVLTRLLRADRLDVEVAVAGRFGVRRALTAPATLVPLIRDDTGTALVGTASWTGSPEGTVLVGEAVVDDTVLFDGDVHGVRIEPTAALPGLRAAVLSPRGRPRGWVSGRAVQLGTSGALLTRDGVAASRPVKRSTFYRHTTGWLRVG